MLAGLFKWYFIAVQLVHLAITRYLQRLRFPRLWIATTKSNLHLLRNVNTSGEWQAATQQTSNQVATSLYAATTTNNHNTWSTGNSYSTTIRTLIHGLFTLIRKRVVRPGSLKRLSTIFRLQRHIGRHRMRPIQIVSIRVIRRCIRSGNILLRILKRLTRITIIRIVSCLARIMTYTAVEAPKKRMLVWFPSVM